MATKSFVIKNGLSFPVGAVAGALLTGDAAGTAAWSNSPSIGGSMTIGGSLTVVGQLLVQGGSTRFDSTIVTIDDPIMTLGGDTAPTLNDSKDRGIEFRWHDGTSAKIGFFGFNADTGSLTFIPDAVNTSEVFSGSKGVLDAYVDWGNVLNKPSGMSSTSGTITAASATPALLITQTGTGDVIRFEDVASPDSTPFIVDSNGATVVGHTAAVAVYAGVTPSLQVHNGNGFAVFNWSGTATGPQMTLGKSRATTPGSFTGALLSGDTLGRLSFVGDSGNGAPTTTHGEISVVAAANWTTASKPTNMQFQTTAAAGVNGLTRMTLTSGGDLGLGIATPAARLHVFQNGTAPALQIVQSGTGHALLVEDTASTDSSPFIITQDGYVINGHVNVVTLASATPREQIHSTSPVSLDLFSWSATASHSVGVAKSRGTLPGTYAAVASGDTVGFDFRFDDGTALVPVGRVLAVAEATATVGAAPSSLAFHTRIAAGADAVERMRLSSDGRLGLGATNLGWFAGGRSIDLPSGSVYSTVAGLGIGLAGNSYFNGTNWKTRAAGGASAIVADTAAVTIWGAPVTTAGANAAMVQVGTFDPAGRLAVGGTALSPAWHSMNRTLDLPSGSVFSTTSVLGIGLAGNSYHDGANWKARAAGGGSQVAADGNVVSIWTSSASAVAGGNLTMNAVAQFDGNGRMALSTSPAGWNPANKSIDMPGGSLWTTPVGLGIGLASNCYADSGGNWRVRNAGGGMQFVVDNAQASLWSMPTAAAGAISPTTRRWSINALGQMFIGTSDTATDSWAKLYVNEGGITIGEISTVPNRDAVLNLGTARTGDGASYIDFISVGNANVDYNARIIREKGTDGSLLLLNDTGVGNIRSQNTNGGFDWVVNSTSTPLMYLSNAGLLGVGTSTPIANFDLRNTLGMAVAIRSAPGIHQGFISWYAEGSTPTVRSGYVGKPGDGLNRFDVQAEGNAFDLALSSAAASVGIWTGGLERIRTAIDGRVGIGDYTSSHRLSVNGSIHASKGVKASLSVDADPAQVGASLLGSSAAAGGFRLGLGMNMSFDGTNWRTGFDGGSNGGAAILTRYGDGDMCFYTLYNSGVAEGSRTFSDESLRGIERMRITRYGQVGIGNAAPLAALDVTVCSPEAYSEGYIRVGVDANGDTATSDRFGTLVGLRFTSTGVPIGRLVGPLDGNASLEFCLGVGGAIRAAITANGNFSSYAGFRAAKGQPSDDNGRAGYAFADDGDTGMFAAGGNSALVFQTDSQVRLFIGSSQGGDNVIRPGTDNSMSLGAPSIRWATVYAASGAISTSDGDTKTDVEDLDAAELEVAKAIKKLVKKFRFKDAAIAKGDAARIHVGVIAQEVALAFEAEGLDPERYAMFCRDVWYEGTAIDTDKDGVETNRVIVQNEPFEGAVGKTRLGIRYEELMAFMIAAM